MKIFKTKLIYVFIAIALTAVFTSPVFASSTDGTIDSTYKYAWGENIGWINFGAANGNVHITDSALSGSALSETVGWINLDNVVNDGEGNLSGYGWGENIGWIKFNPANGGAAINSSGEFSGSALSETVGWIIFGGDHKVKTDWRPRSARPACNNATDDDGDGKIDYPADPGCSSLDDEDETDPGGGMPPAAYNPPSSPSSNIENPTGEFKVIINNGDEYTTKATVFLKLIAGADTAKMAISNTPDFKNAGIIAYQKETEWDLISGRNEALPRSYGANTVYAKFYTQYGQPSQIVSDEIILDMIAPEIKITEIKDYYSAVEDVVLIAETEANAEIILRWDKKYGLMRANKQGKLTINLGKMPAGNYQLELTPADLAGNKGGTLTVNLTIKPAKEVPEAEPEVISEVEQEKPPLIERVPEILEPLVPEVLEPLVPEFLKPKEEEEEKTEEMIVIPEETPISMRGEWNLFPQKQVNEFVLAPLPKGLERLAEKFPELQETFEKVGINKITDLEKLRNAKLSLHGLSKSAIFSEKELALFKNTPLSELSDEIKDKIPSEIIFAKIGDKKSVDFDIELSVGNQGEVRQKITVVSGQKLTLTVKPESKARSVYGYLAFKGTGAVGSIVPQGCGTQMQTACKTAPQPRLAVARLRTMEPAIFRIQDLFNSFVFAKPVFAKDYNSDIEEKLVTQKFAYTDSDNDGIWNAEIQTPIVEGEYEIITLIEYEDPEFGTRMIKLTTVVDPEGYVYERIGNQELRIKDAVVSIYKLNSESDEYELWQAGDYQQKNSQTTDATGRYSFLVPEGTYYLAVEALGYSPYQSEPFIVQEGAGIHQNIELKAKNAWLKMLDWKVAAIFLLFVLVVWNFWRDRKRNF